MPSDSPPDLLSRLRAATAVAHQKMEDQIDIPKVCAAQESYEHLLECFLGFFDPFEAALQTLPGWEDHGFRWSERAKSPMLHADLHSLGHSTAEIAALPRCTDLPRPANLAEAFGCAYVLEGSTLGGRHITGILTQSAIPEDSRHYFASYGENVATRWREFCTMLADFPLTDADAMTGMAVKTFDKLGAWFYSCK